MALTIICCCLMLLQERMDLFKCRVSRIRKFLKFKSINKDMDPTLQWCERMKENNRLKLKCSFCGNTFSRGISRMKHHLAGTSKDVSPCGGGPNTPWTPFVRQQCLDMLHDLRQKRIQKEIEEADVGNNEPLEDEEEEEEAYECDDEDDSSLRTDLETSRDRDRRGKGIMYEGSRSGIMERKRRGTADIRARRGMRPPSGRVPTGRGDEKEEDEKGTPINMDLQRSLDVKI
ncbi:hypothetical protein EJ110_NYTH59294 [Nymphaea thermarum]|nr:hypothetical protein EJ110_NYTH59294 [Nymphaea thermarum]